MTPKSAATKRHLLTQVEFPTGFSNSRATLMQLTLRKTKIFWEKLMVAQEHERPTKSCQRRWRIQPSVLSPSVAVSQQPGKARTWQPWAESATIPSHCYFCLYLSVQYLSCLPLKPCFSQPQQQHHLQCRGPVHYCKY